MSNSFKTVIAIVVAALVIAILPMMAVSERANDQAQVIAEKEASEFVNNAATTGSIKLSNYDNLITALGTTGNTYNVDLMVERIGENIGKKTTWIQGDVIGENSTYQIFTESILDDLDKTGVFNLNRGDKFTVSIKNNSSTLASNFRKFVFGVNDARNYEIVAEHSATVSKTGGK